jgi:hypothetical protein
MKRILLPVALLSLGTCLQAGTWGGKTPVPKAPIEECLDLGGEVSVGYETDYIFRGVRFARDSVRADVNYTFEGLMLPLTVGTTYLNGINGAALGAGFDQLDLYARAGLGSFAGFDAFLGYTHRTFPEFRSNFSPFGGFGEINFGVSYGLGFADLVFGTNYAFGGGGLAPSGWFHQLGIQRTLELTDTVGLALGAGVAYSDGYWIGSGWNHYYLTAGLPISLNCRTTLTPYIGYTGGPNTWVVDGIIGANEPQSDILHGGVSLMVTF